MTRTRPCPALAMTALATALLASPAWSQSAPSAPSAPGDAARRASAEVPAAGGEPRVQHIVIEDDRARIDELHVRGEARSIKVQPKGPGPKVPYEVVPASGARDISAGMASQKGMAGQRVWNVLAF